MTGSCPTSGSSGHRYGGMAFAGVAGNSPAASARRSATPLALPEPRAELEHTLEVSYLM